MATTAETVLSTLDLGTRAKKALETLGVALTATVGALATYNVEAALKEGVSPAALRQLQEIAVSAGLSLSGADKIPAANKREKSVAASELPSEFEVRGAELVEDGTLVKIAAEDVAFTLVLPREKAPALGSKVRLVLEAK